MKIHFSLIFMILSCYGFSQVKTNLIKAQMSLGLNNPSNSGFVQNFEPKLINFPTVNLGVQYMFKQRFGGKLDFGYSRFSNSEKSPEFKVNYTRLNLQLVYDANRLLSLPNRYGVFAHIGPGISFVSPLGNYPNNDVNFFNTQAGVEFHYGMSETLSFYSDLSYTYSFAGDFDPVSSGHGSFNGDLITLSFGFSVSLSGCYFCD